MADPLKKYRDKRDFGQTPEPAGGADRADGNMFMVHKHSATNLHYDLRLQIGDTLKSWAVPKGPSLDPAERRLAVEVEQHPLEYGSFEGVIPEGQYGAGPTLIWDRGTWAPMGDLAQSLKSGTLKFRLAGEKLNGGWTLARLKPRKGDRNPNWLLIKEHDRAAREDGDILVDRPESVASGRTIDDLLPTVPKRKRRRRLSAVRGAVRKAMPVSIAPQLATPIETPPPGADWLHEIKLDGYRTLAFVDNGVVKLATRNGHDWTDRYGDLPATFLSLNCRQAIIDGEVVVLDDRGVSRFSELQAALAGGERHRFVYFAFDLLYLNGWDLCGVALVDRKALLRDLVADVQGDDAPIQFCDHIVGKGAEFFDRACELGLEGVVSKRAGSRYEKRRSRSWLKAKAKRTATFTIVGYTTSRAAGGLAALLLAEEDEDGGLRYVGKVGTGFTATEAHRLEKTLAGRPLKVPPPTLRGTRQRAHWTEPVCKALVQFSELTRDGHIRHGVFRRLIEVAAPVRAAEPPRRYITDKHLADIWVTNPDRHLFSRDGPTKLDLAVYYARVGDYMLPHILNRPVSFVRCPTGKRDDCFFQRHPFSGMPDTIGSFVARDEPEKNRRYLTIRSAEGFLSLAQYGAVELHPWGCRIDRPDRPDRMVFDLDPGEGLEWRHIVDAAFHVHDHLATLGLPSFAKTTGSKGIHVVVPLERRYGWKTLHATSGAVASAIAAEAPHAYTSSLSKRDRIGRILIDFHRNTFSATAVAAYSVRALPGLPVSTPLCWEDLRSIDDPAELNYHRVSDLVTKSGDAWADIAAQASRLPRSVMVSR